MNKTSFSLPPQLMHLNILAAWTVVKNEFYDINDVDRLSARERWIYLYGLEDMLMLTNGVYCLDLGWYGGADDGPDAGYRIHLLRGEWYNGDLMERFSSKDRHAIAERIQCFIQQVDAGAYDQAVPLPWVKDQVDGSVLP